MTRILFAVLACCITTTLLVACSSGNDNPNDPDTMVDVATEISDRYQGNFATGCVPVGAGGQQNEISLVGRVGTQTITDYNTADCTNPILTTEFTFDVTFPGGTQETPIGDADFLDLIIMAQSVNGEAADLSSVPEDNLRRYDIVILVDEVARFGRGQSTTPDDRPTELGDLSYVRQ